MLFIHFFHKTSFSSNVVFVTESVNNPNSPIIKEITSTLAQLQSEQKYENATKGESTILNRNTDSMQVSQPNFNLTS